ncbi:MAG: hypothetical protein DRR19_20340 [Candidatus Parabeggiatoa sp. nov. 1]|nr:MAG: hypothetical protein DRR19_20340 [Gammaproteobacteria bacterium]
MTSTYRIEDEPQSSQFSHLVVNPFWPLLGLMFGGAWLAWPWFVVNGFAVGSPTRWRELGWVIGGFIGSTVLAVTIFVLYNNNVIHSDSSIQYAILVLLVWKITVSYTVFTLQARTFELYEYYGGIVRNGIWVLLLATFLGRKAVLTLLPFKLWILVMS